MKIAVAVLAILCFAGAASAAPKLPTPQVTGHTVILTWDVSADSGVSYNVYRAPSCAGTFAKISAAPVSALTFSDTALAPGSYAYQVTAALGGAESVPSNCVTAVILPAAPKNVRVTGVN